jgi:hypothetical protein
MTVDRGNWFARREVAIRSRHNQEEVMMRFYKMLLLICLLFVPTVTYAGEYDGGVQAKVLLKATTTGNGTPISY